MIGFVCRIWAECSGANEAREPGLYQELLSQHKGEENQCLTQIDMDCTLSSPFFGLPLLNFAVACRSSYFPDQRLLCW